MIHPKSSNKLTPFVPKWSMWDGICVFDVWVWWRINKCDIRRSAGDLFWVLYQIGMTDKNNAGNNSSIFRLSLINGWLHHILTIRPSFLFYLYYVFWAAVTMIRGCVNVLMWICVMCCAAVLRVLCCPITCWAAATGSLTLDRWRDAQETHHKQYPPILEGNTRSEMNNSRYR